MFSLFRKDCPWFFLNTMGFLVSATFFFYNSAEDGSTDSRIVYQIALLLIFLVCFSLFSSELKESYLFLQILPVSASEIVASKFFLVLTQVVLFWCFVLLLLSSADWPPSDFAFGVGLINICAILSLLLAAFWYWGIFRYGLAISSKILLVFCFGVIIVVIFLADVFEGRVSEWQIVSLPLTGWVFLFILALAVYFFLMRVAIRAKIAGETDR